MTRGSRSQATPEYGIDEIPTNPHLGRYGGYATDDDGWRGATEAARQNLRNVLVSADRTPQSEHAVAAATEGLVRTEANHMRGYVAASYGYDLSDDVDRASFHERMGSYFGARVHEMFDSSLGRFRAHVASVYMREAAAHAVQEHEFNSRAMTEGEEGHDRAAVAADAKRILSGKLSTIGSDITIPEAEDDNIHSPTRHEEMMLRRAAVNGIKQGQREVDSRAAVVDPNSTPAGDTDTSHPTQRGPRGGQFYLTKNGRKVYVQSGESKRRASNLDANEIASHGERHTEGR